MNTPSVAFVLSSGEISGGTNVIFRHAMQLANDGAIIGLISDKVIAKEVVCWHPIGEVYEHPNLRWLDFFDASAIDFEVAIATFWSTYFNLSKISAAHYAYFVQSIESRFYPPSERILRNLIDATYDMPCGFVTEAKWIQRYLAQIHQQSAFLVPNGVDKRVFNGDGGSVAPRIHGRLRVLVEGAVDVEFKNVPAAIRLARRAGADEVWLLTPSVITSHRGVDRVFSRVPHYATADIYRSCDILLKLSLVEGMFGPPLESFHCGGTCLVYDVTGHDEYIEHGINGIVVPTGDEDKVVTELKRLRDTPDLLAALKRNAAATAAAWPDWAHSSQLFGKALQNIIDTGTIKQDQLARYSRRIWFFGTSRDAATAVGAATQRQRASRLRLIERGLRHLREYGWGATVRRTILCLRAHDIPCAQLRRAGKRLQVLARRAANRLLN